MKNIQYLIIVSLLKLSLSALNCAEQHETNHAKAARLAIAKINAAEHSATGLSWEDIDRLKMMSGQNERAEQIERELLENKIANPGATGLSWEDIDRLKMVPGQHERAEQLALAKINAAEHSATGLSWEDIDRLKMMPEQHN